MKILIIGGTGLISTAITRYLLERGDDVTLCNRGKAESPQGAKQITGDRKDFNRFEAQMAEAGTFDCVLDMICYLPEEAHSDIRAFKGRVGHFIFCSTVDVYSKPATRYPYLDNEPHGALNSYGQNKSICEQLFMEAHERGDFPVTTLRPAHTYGDSGALIHSFGWGMAYLDRLRRGKPIIVHGNGQSLWVSAHVNDVGLSFVHAAGNEQAYGKGYHVTGEEWLTWNQYYQKAAEVMGWPEPNLVHIPVPLLCKVAPQLAGSVADNFQFNNIFDNSAAKADLDFRYTVTYADGVRRVVSWSEEHGKIQSSDENLFYDRLLATWQRHGDEMAHELSSNSSG
ncbi:MAG: NAD-dependent epimerase/dehydratase family protein [Abitibacteriaceae bacterium]|nr:NAD-dependent epimerase/dehydratase family protein [Abditibacteriaceae bacterium]MBV9866988.1 NAD-dependent epimerase/dehydratase family protein [Abditibacteriaceae bacterium]